MSQGDEELATLVRDALVEGRLGLDDLSARRLGALAGKTTSLVYHHYGSLDGLLYAVAQSGLVLLAGRLAAAEAEGAELPELAAEFVRFGLELPSLYALMFERRYDWAALRRAGALGAEQPGLLLFQLLVERLAAAGAPRPRREARMLFAGLHGLVSLALSGRANLGELELTDEAAALEAARELARRLGEPRRKDHGHDPRPVAPRPRHHAQEPARQGGDERAARRRGRRAH